MALSEVVYVNASNGSGPDYTVDIYVQSESPGYNGIKIGQIIVDELANYYTITDLSGVSYSGGLLNGVVVQATDDAAVRPATQWGFIFDPTESYGLSVPPTTGTGVTYEKLIRCFIRDNQKITDPNLGKNKYILGQSGYASHYIDNSGNNDVNSYIEYDATDKTHYHRIEPKVDANYIDIRIAFLLPSTFTGLSETGNALEFFAKVDNGSTDSVNSVSLTTLITPDGTEYTVTGEEVTTAPNRTQIDLTKAEVDSILNPTSSSSSSSAVELTSTDAGGILYAEFKMFGNDGDNVYLDQDNALLYTK
jgi:hypothetical protein